MTLTHLIERCESGSGPDRELDCLVAAALDLRVEGENMPLRHLIEQCGIGWVAENAERHQSFYRHALPRYTTSLDAVVSLIGQKLPGWKWSAMSFADQFKGNAWSDDLEVELYAFAKSPARALLAAFLKAYANKEGTDPAPKASP